MFFVGLPMDVQSESVHRQCAKMHPYLESLRLPKLLRPARRLSDWKDLDAKSEILVSTGFYKLGCAHKNAPPLIKGLAHYESAGLSVWTR